jgi:hypothetical protein
MNILILYINKVLNIYNLLNLCTRLKLYSCSLNILNNIREYSLFINPLFNFKPFIKVLYY